MNDKSFELNIVILFILLFVLTLIVINCLYGRLGRLYNNCFVLCGIYVHPLCNFIDYIVITALKSTNKIKMHPLFTDSYISNKFG